jgi:LysW-gamma-L-lysine carboxypeptidase
VLKTGTADLNIVAPAWGCPAVAYGPGDSALDHTPNEHISLAEYSRAVKVLVAVLKQLTSQGIRDRG